MRSLALALPSFVAAALYAGTTGQAGQALLLALPALLACVRRADADVSPPAQVLLAIGCGMLAFGMTSFAPSGRGIAEEPLEPAWLQLAQASLLLAGLRLHMRRPVMGGLGGTLGLGLLVFLACGTVRTGDFYPALLGVYAVFAWVALRVDDVAAGGRSGLRWPGGRVAAATLVVLAVSAAMTAGLAVAIPRFYALAYAWALDWVDERHRAGFHDGPLRLGALGSLLESDTIVMRVEGDAGERLRGNVYTHFARGRWLPAPRREERPLRTSEADAGAAPGGGVRAVVRYARSGADRYFLPTLGGAIRLAPAEARVDEMGVVRTAADEEAERVALLDAGSRSFAPAPPRSADLDVPDDVRDWLGGLHGEWAAGHADPGDRIAAIRQRLEADYTYSLRADNGDAQDALARFLGETRAGHCELFASAMTLLARAGGVPARLVTGYRIAEHNPYGGYAIVRERHAHAWTEVHLEGRGWVTVDPAPLRGDTPAEAEQTPWAAGLVDWAIVALSRHGLELLLGVLVLGLAGVQLWRIRRDRAGRTRDFALEVSPPPEWLARLLERLEASGLGRSESEPLESLARRARVAARSGRAFEIDLGEAALLLGRYTALRYGDEGNAEAVREDVLRFVERSRRLTAASP